VSSKAAARSDDNARVLVFSRSCIIVHVWRREATGTLMCINKPSTAFRLDVATLPASPTSRRQDGTGEVDAGHRQRASVRTMPSTNPVDPAPRAHRRSRGYVIPACQPPEP
jgi:hypothetical protein